MLLFLSARGIRVARPPNVSRITSHQAAAAPSSRQPRCIVHGFADAPLPLPRRLFARARPHPSPAQRRLRTAPHLAGDRRPRFPFRRGGAPAVPRRRFGARRDAGRARARPGFHHIGAPRGDPRHPPRLHPRNLGHRPRFRDHRRHEEGGRQGVADRGHHLPRRRLRIRLPQTGGRLRGTDRGGPRPPRLHRQRHGRGHRGG